MNKDKRRIKSWGLVFLWNLALGCFVYSACFQAWVFWQLYKYVEITLFDPFPGWRVFELVLALLVLLLAVSAFVIYWVRVAQHKRLVKYNLQKGKEQSNKTGGVRWE